MNTGDLTVHTVSSINVCIVLHIYRENFPSHNHEILFLTEESDRAGSGNLQKTKGRNIYTKEIVSTIKPIITRHK